MNRNSAIVAGIKTINNRGEMVESVYSNDMDEFIILAHVKGIGGWKIYSGHDDELDIIVDELELWGNALECFNIKRDLLETSADNYFMEVVK